MAALIREPPRGDAPARRVSLRASADELDVSKIARASGDGGGHRQAAGFSSSDSIEEITEFIRREFVEATRAPRALTPSGLVLFDKPAGPSSFAIVRDIRDRTGARAGHAGTLDPFATGLLLVLLGAFTKEAQRFVGVTKRYETAVDLSARTSTGDPEGEVVDEHEPLSEAELGRGSTSCGARSTCASRQLRR